MSDLKEQPVPLDPETGTPPPSSRPRPRREGGRRFLKVFLKTLVGFLIACVVFSHISNYRFSCRRFSWNHSPKHRLRHHPQHHFLSDGGRQDICPQYSSKVPSSAPSLDAQYDSIRGSSNFRKHAAELLAGLVRVKSESFDDSGPVGEDPRWDVFADVHAYLDRSFPLIRKTLEKRTANTYGLLYTWKGSDSSLKPLLLMAHQDTVPVELNTADKWEHDPWSGYIDDHYVYGRGSADDKSSLISIMIAIERLIKTGFKPQRTILLSFGFDEESKGYQGANHLAQLIESIYGRDSIEMIIDEGGGVTNLFGTQFGAVSTGEKGYLDLNVTLHTPGGHSSAPPGPTNTEILSDILNSLKHIRYKPHLTGRNPHLAFLKCAASYAPDLPAKLRDAVLDIDDDPDHESPYSKHVARVLADAGGYQERYILQTSQATTILRSGVKANELPEYGFVLLNHRIAVEEDAQSIRQKSARILRRKAKEYGLGLKLFGEETFNKGKNGQLEAVSFGNLDPAPLSPTFGDRRFETFAGTVKHVWEEDKKDRDSSSSNDDLVVAPSIMTGNTDTRYYWNLTRNIYRYAQITEKDAQNVHTVDEKLGIDSLVSNIAFYHEFIRNVDEM